MEIILNKKEKNKITYDDLNYGDVFLSFNRLYPGSSPYLYMKVEDGGDAVLNLENGRVSNNVYHYPIDQVVDKPLEIEYEELM